MALISFSPQQAWARFLTLVFPQATVTALADTATVTAAQLLGGMLTATKNGTSTLTLPTAAAINALIPGVGVGCFFDFLVRNTGNNTATVAVGTGITSATGNTLTVATVNTRLFRLVCTGVANSGVVGSADSYDLYSLGVSAH